MRRWAMYGDKDNYSHSDRSRIFTKGGGGGGGGRSKGKIMCAQTREPLRGWGPAPAPPEALEILAS